VRVPGPIPRGIVRVVLELSGEDVGVWHGADALTREVRQVIPRDGG
jgi:hypothetical protein